MPLYRPKEIKQSEKLFTIALIISIVGNVYVIKQFNIGYGEIIVFFAIVVCIIKDGFRFSVKSSNESIGFLVFFIYSFLISITVAMVFSNIDFSNTTMRLTRDVFYIFTIFLFSSKFFNRRYAIRLLIILSLALSVFIIFQFMIYLIAHIYVSGLVSWLPLASEDLISLKLQTLKTAAILGYLRPNGFLIEPASCAQILSIALMAVLFTESGMKKLIKIGIICVGMVLTTSLNAMVLLPATFFVFYLLMIKKEKGRIPVKWFVLSMLIILVGAVAYSAIPFVQATIHRFTYLGTTTTGSTSVRLLRGLFFFKEIPLIYKISGIGFGNFIGFKEAFSITTAYEIETEYFNTASYILISTGIMGFSIIILSLYKLYKRLDWMSRGILIMIIITSLSSSIYSSPYMLIAMSLVICGGKDNGCDVGLL